MPVSIINIARNSLKFTSVKTVAALLGLGVTLYAATILRPEEYGTYGLLILWITYANLVTPGTNNAASREIPILLGKGRDEAARRLQNVSISAELFFTVIPAAVIIAAAFCYIPRPSCGWGCSSSRPASSLPGFPPSGQT
jgi:O-antigen/teichoic acid export membrane protein